MGHFAKVKDGKVLDLIVAEPEFFETFVDSTPGEWIQTSYNTHSGEHPEDRPLRYNFARIGGWYNTNADAFYDIQPYPSWTLNETTFQWDPPVPMPEGQDAYTWNEEQQNWEISEV